MFYAHSSLLERAGRLEANGKCLTCIPVVHAAHGDITAYLPTNIMSITDGQWILDMDVFRSGVRPSISTGLSVTRAGGAGHNKRQKAQASQTLKTLADYRQAEEFSHFGTELVAESRRALNTGKRLLRVLTQAPSDTFSLTAQQMMLDIVLNLADGEEIDFEALKQNVENAAKEVKKDEDFDKARDDLKARCLVQQAAKAPPPAKEPEKTPAEAKK
jgi:F-type H+-transporting ATPase subunit alpha